MEMYRSGATMKSIAKHHRCRGNHVIDVLARHGLKPQQGGHRKFTDAEEIEIARRYDEGVLSGVLAREYGCSLGLIRRIARDRGSLINGRGNRITPVRDDQVAEIVRLRQELLLSQAEIGECVGLSQGIVSRVLREQGKFTRLRKLRVSRDGHGYLHESVADDDALNCMATTNGFISQHRLVMARALNRPLTATETVHHINGIRDDNRIENLQLRQGRHGKGVVAQCLDCGSHNVGTTEIKEHAS